MADWPIYIWILLAVVVLVIIVILVMVSRKQGEVRNRERAAELRTKASDNEPLIGSRQERAVALEEKAGTARHEAVEASERADSLRAEAGEFDERAAHATEQAEILDDEATHSREALEEAVQERDEALREADRRDPDVHTDRHGNRIDDEADEAVPADNVIPEDERLDVEDDHLADEFAEPDADYIDPVEHDRMDNVRIPEGFADDVDSTHTRAESAAAVDVNESVDHSREDGPFVDEVEATPVYVDESVDHSREDDSFASDVDDVDATPVYVDESVDHSREDDSFVGDVDDVEATPVYVGDPVDDAKEGEWFADDGIPTPAREDEASFAGTRQRVDEDDLEDDFVPAAPTMEPVTPSGATARRMEFSPAEDALETDGPLLDPYGNPVVVDDVSGHSANEDDDIPRDDLGRRLDPYGNPVPEDRDL